MDACPLDRSRDEQIIECPVCGAAMEGYHCKLTCRNCGYQEDCSDLFRAGPIEIPRSGRQKDRLQGEDSAADDSDREEH